MTEREGAYAARLDEERRHYDGVSEFDDLPPIYHYWSHTFVRPMIEPLGCSNPIELLAHYLHEGARRTGAPRPAFISFGSGDANGELQVARLLEAADLADFTIECLEMNPALIERASAAAAAAGLSSRVTFVQGDFNEWKPSRTYDGVMANQSLHHVSNLEGLFDAVREALAPGATFVTSDIIGRNGHQRWPEARHFVDRFWRDLPEAYRYNCQLRRYEETFEDWDCSSQGFEGIRAQDVLPLLIQRFAFEVFVGFGAAIDPFVDRGFGPNFKADAPWDRAFIDRVHDCDERALLAGVLTPTHMMAVLRRESCESPYFARGLRPDACVRSPDWIVSAAEIEAADRILSDAVQSDRPRLPVRGGVRQTSEARGAHVDNWVGNTLEFSVAPIREVRRIRARLSVPEHAPADSEISLWVDGTRVGETSGAGTRIIDCAVRLPLGRTVTVRIETSATVNLYALGLADDARDLGFHLDEIVFD